MNAKLSIILSFLLLFTLSSHKTDTGIVFQQGDLQSALNLSAENNKIVFVDAYTTWCGPCKQLDKVTFKQEDVGTFFNENFINVKSNLEKGDGPNVQKRYNIRSVPTLLFLDENGKVLKKLVGFQNRSQLLKAAKDVQAAHGTKS